MSRFDSHLPLLWWRLLHDLWLSMPNHKLLCINSISSRKFLLNIPRSNRQTHTLVHSFSLFICHMCSQLPSNHVAVWVLATACVHSYTVVYILTSAFVIDFVAHGMFTFCAHFVYHSVDHNNKGQPLLFTFHNLNGKKMEFLHAVHVE